MANQCLSTARLALQFAHNQVAFRPPCAFANRGSWKIGIERQWDGRNMEDEKERLSLDADGKPKARRIRTHLDALLHPIDQPRSASRRSS